MASWQLQTAKARLSELIRMVKVKGPQIITLHGREEAVLLSKRDYERLRKKKPDVVEFFKHFPFHGVELRMDRNKTLSRRVQL